MAHKVSSKIMVRKTVFQGSSGILLMIIWRHVIYEAYLGYLESLILLNILSSIVEDETIVHESSGLLPGVKTVLLASLSVLQKTCMKRTGSRHENSRFPLYSLNKIVGNDNTRQNHPSPYRSQECHPSFLK